MARSSWKSLAATQAGLLTRAQLNMCGIDRWAVRHRIRTGRWIEHTPTVIGTVTGELTRSQLSWLGVLHAGGRSLVGALTAAELHGLENWHRDHVSVLIDKNADVGKGHPSVEYVRTRRDLAAFRRAVRGLPVCRLEPAVLLFAARQRSARTAEGVIAAVVQQRLTTPVALGQWLARPQVVGVRVAYPSRSPHRLH